MFKYLAKILKIKHKTFKYRLCYCIMIILVYLFMISIPSMVRRFSQGRIQTPSNVLYPLYDRSYLSFKMNQNPYFTQKRIVKVTNSSLRFTYNDSHVRLLEEERYKKCNLSRHFRDHNQIHLSKVSIVTNAWNLCTNHFGSDLDLFVNLWIRVGHFELRETIRKTWANRTLFPTMNVGFILGSSENATINSMVEEESRKYGDIIQGSFIDSYRNLTFKSLTAWRWITHACMHASYFLKLDDDVFLMTARLLNFLNKQVMRVSSEAIVGEIWTESRPFRDRSSKFFVTQEEWSGDLYPPYSNGPGYLMTRQVPPLFYELSFTNRDFWLVSGFYFENFEFE
jgi:hypothetical protein